MWQRFQELLSPLGRLGKVFLVLLALHALAWLAQIAAGWTLPGWGLLKLSLYIFGFLLLSKLLRMGMSKMLWRVRNRMVMLFLFIGLVPLVLVAMLIGLAVYMLTGQAAVYMADSELQRRAARLEDAAEAVRESVLAAPGAAEPAAEAAVRRAAEGRAGLLAWIRAGERATVFPRGAELGEPQPALRGFRGIVRRGVGLYQLAQAGPPPVEVALLVPLSETYLAGLAPGLGRVSVVSLHPLAAGQANVGFTLSLGDSRFALDETVRSAPAEAPAQLPPARNFLDRPVTWFTLPFPPQRWRESDLEEPAILMIQTRPSAVYRLLFGQRFEVARGLTIAFLIVATLLLIVELLSLVIGVSITRTLTSSVRQLYDGTQKVDRGDFSSRIQVRGQDQLAELSQSFNHMTASIERLIEESKERERLASELAIAREVQEQLFPKAPPAMKNLEILGLCHAARMVSGDYYDFVKMADDRVALAIGDVAGKGISGALLMASIQSMLRTQLSAGGGGANGVWRYPTAKLVSQLNQQLYENTSPEKYATFFFGAFDDRHGLLTYTNAGHLPPIRIRNGEPRRLDVNGMVVGAFPFARYEQSEIDLEPGDLLVGFTDGVTEPENDFAEEFGEDRLVELLVRHWQRPLREISDAVVAAVNQWTGRPELQDDMTLLLARRR